MLVPIYSFTSSVWEFQLLSTLASSWCNLAGCAVVMVVQLLSHVRPFATPWTVTRLAPLSSTISQSLLQVAIEAGMLPNHLILCAPFSSCLQSFPASGSLASKCAEGSNYVLSLQFLSDLIIPNSFNSYLPINVALIFKFLIISYIGHISIWLLVIWITSFVKCLFRYFVR